MPVPCGPAARLSTLECRRRRVRCVIMGAWGTGAFENDSALDLLGDIVDERFSFEGLVQAPRLRISITGLASRWLSWSNSCWPRGLREMPVTDGVSDDLVPRVVSRGQAAWLLEQMPRVLGQDSEEYELWSGADPKTFAEWVEHVNAAIADLRRVLGPGEHHPELF